VRRDEAGMVAGAEGLAFGFLIFVVGLLIVANAWAVIDAKLAVTAAAREAARAYVEAPNPPQAAAAAQAAADGAIAGHRREGTPRLTLAGEPFGRCSRIAITAEYDVALAAIPVIAVTEKVFTVAARHSEVVDPYRSSGATGPARCTR
jgi:Flp pilus assembly protein TadG